MTAPDSAGGDPRRGIPATHALLSDPRLADALAELGRDRVKAAVRRAQQLARDGTLPHDEVLDASLSELARLGVPGGRSGSAGTTGRGDRQARRYGFAPVINATGVVVHTNLGRAALSAAARDALAAAAGSTDVEFDLTSGVRARRGRGTTEALAELVPDAEQVHVVNNNAAALLLCALELASGKEILLSRGQFVEIGDGFRVPELLASTNARIREVGTTNRTHLSDYEQAIGPETGFILVVHPSNYQVSGFTSTVDVSELAELGVPVVADIGSGLLSPHPVLPDEPDATSMLRAGAWLVTASGDKLLGGPQAGLILGRAELVHRLRRHPAARALRVDKLTLAALEATLRDGGTPVDQALRAEETVLAERAARLTERCSAAGVEVRAVRCESVVGGGGAPEVRLPSHGLSLPQRYAAALRTGTPPVVGRVSGGRCVLDLRTVAPQDDADLVTAVTGIAAGVGTTDRTDPAASAGAPDAKAGGPTADAVPGDDAAVDAVAGDDAAVEV